MRNVIGVIPLYDDERDSYWMVPGYMKMLEEAGGIPMMLPLTANPEELDYFLEICGGFLLTGGHDVSPSIYHAERKPWCGPCCETRDEMERYILEHAVEMDKSTVSIHKGTPLYDILNEEQIGVNSYHHQAVRDLSPVFQAMSVAEDGLIEGIFMPSRRFVLGVQWHPEFSYEMDEHSRKLVQAFVDSIV